jgi:NAD(P)-dependent dehydrogenase (short-subunit alcohol dehydrogenase family)
LQSRSRPWRQYFHLCFSTWRDTAYAAIDPTNPRHAAKGKVVVVTGGDAGIGKAVSRAFAQAGALKIAILGRREQLLLSVKADLESEFKGLTILAAAADISDQAAIDSLFIKIANDFGNINILINNAGYQPNIQPIKESSLDDFWKGFEVNVKGSFVITQAFLRVCNPNASLINFTTGLTHLPFVPGMTGYVTSKVASAKFFDYLQAENPGLQVVNVHPGVIMTEMYDKTIAAGIILPYDDSESTQFHY